MRVDGIEGETIIINPYRYPKTDISQNKALQLGDFKRIQIAFIEQSDTKKTTISSEHLNRLMEELKHKFSMLEKYLKIQIDEILQIPISKIIDMRTEEVIRQIPPEWIVEILRRMEELKGIFYSKEA
ncbi:MAG: flagellar protein FlaG [Thermodesulfovibrionaceae bacterium]